MFALALLKIPVSGLGPALAFYEGALGLPAEFVAEEYGWAQLAGAGLPLALYVPGKGGGNRRPGGSLDFHLAHPSPAALLTQIEAAAPDAGAALHSNADGSQSLECRDPDGNEIKIMKSA
ncbi:MAG: VOC family protein [Pseudomonadota bacterium]